MKMQTWFDWKSLYTVFDQYKLQIIQNLHTVKPARAVTSIKRSTFSCPVIENFILIEPLLNHLQYKATFSLSQIKTQETSITSCIHTGLDKQSNKGFYFFFETITIKDKCFTYVLITDLSNKMFYSYFWQINTLTKFPTSDLILA